MSSENIPEATVYMDDVFAINASDPLIVLRSHAIEAFAGLEQGLCSLFSYLMGVDAERAEIVFYKIINSSTRDSILEKLFRLAMPEENQSFWFGEKEGKGRSKKNGLKTLISQLTETRNHIVHWHVAHKVIGRDDGSYSTHLSLIPPMIRQQSPLALVASDLIEFIEKVRFCSRLLNIFTMHFTLVSEKKWVTVFERPPEYPPEYDHPFSVEDRKRAADAATSGVSGNGATA